MIIIVIMVMVMMMIMMMMIFQWRVDGSVDIPTQDSDLSDEPINEAVSRSALGTRGKGGIPFGPNISLLQSLWRSGKGLKAYPKNGNHE